MSDATPRRVILTPDQRLRVFVSSTLQELADERVAAREAVTRLRLAPVMFELGARLWYALRPIYDRSVATVRAQLDEATWTKLYAEGHAMTLEQAVVYSLEEVSRA